MGSGHILVYAFDVLMQIYESQGYTQRDAAQSILQNNLYGLDIDERAAQLAYFAVMMKARQYDRRIFSRGIQPHVYGIVESNGLSGLWTKDNKDMQELFDAMRDAKEYGSILTAPALDYGSLREFAKNKVASIEQFDLESNDLQDQLSQVLALIDVAEVLAGKYQISATNPPYMSSSNMDVKLSKFTKDNFPDSKSDMFAIFIERCGMMTAKNGYQAMITQHSWMFLSSFTKLRMKTIQKRLISMAHLGARAFDEIGGEVVQTTAFVVQNSYAGNSYGVYCRLLKETSQAEKEEAFLEKKSCFVANQEMFSKVPGAPLAYWGTINQFRVFEDCDTLAEVANPRQGLITGDVNRFVRKWYECSIENLSFDSKYDTSERAGKWFPYCNGGGYRKWYGNNEDVVNWERDGYEVKNFVDGNGKQRSRPQNQQYYFREGGTWSAISTSKLSVRYFGEGFLFSNAGMAIYAEHDKLRYIIGFLNSNLSQLYLGLFNEGLNYNQGDIAKLPIRIKRQSEIIQCVEQAISAEKDDWDSFEESWDFRKHPLI
ncbi:MAG: BREX-1 system adenine-specific DNA-methyltransferase PglX [Clostridiales bacterium]|nr:BREX-1 system adenine-specific DNA-methyltransferase PglX [Clostridiales bacterium]